MKIDWEKLACALLAAALLMAGWGLWTVHEVDKKLSRIEGMMDAWHEPVGSNAVMLAGGKGGSCEMRLEFLQRSTVKSYNEVKTKQYDRALHSMMLGLNESGWYCKEFKDRLECQR